jgi:hypothetical protein
MARCRKSDGFRNLRRLLQLEHFLGGANLSRGQTVEVAEKASQQVRLHHLEAKGIKVNVTIIDCASMDGEQV